MKTDPRAMTYTELVQTLQGIYTREQKADEKHAALMAIGESAFSALADMVSALDVDYDRLQELREKSKAGHYVAGWNMPGCMPDSEPAAFDDADSAREYLAHEIEEHAEDIEPDAEQPDGADIEECARLRADVASMRESAEELRLMTQEGARAEYGQTIGQWHYWISYNPGLADADEREEYETLVSAAGDCEDSDDAERRIQEDPLDIEYRGTGQRGEPFDPDECMILLSTGGPAVRIVAELSDRGVHRAKLQVQDWFTPWTDFYCESSILVRYCDCLAIGEY